MVTIYDIAEKTGLSPATVSKVFNGYNGVSEKAKKLVLTAANEMGYTPNTNARALVTKKAWLLGVLFNDNIGAGIAHPHYSQILQSFHKTAEVYGYDVVFVNGQLGDRKISYADHCRYRGVDGVLLAADENIRDDIQCVLDSGIKCVSVEGVYPGVSTVITDNMLGTRQALEYLYYLGHRRIAHIAGPQASVAGRERFEAYVEFLASKGIPFDPKLVVYSEYYDQQSKMDVASMLLQQCWDDMPTAIYAVYDEVACATQLFLMNQGFRIPRDMSIIGFDDLMITEYTTPPMTTIAQDREAIGQTAAKVLIDMIENNSPAAAQQIRIPPRLVVRGSCARI